MRTDREIEIIDTPDERPRPKKPKKKKSTNRLILNTTIAFTVLFMGMLAYFVHFEYSDADEVINSTYNKRQDILAQSVIRGDIKAANGEGKR